MKKKDNNNKKNKNRAFDFDTTGSERYRESCMQLQDARRGNKGDMGNVPRPFTYMVWTRTYMPASSHSGLQA